ncbi:MAG: alpha/beta hydrolase [Lachnospiraceae bacterium]|nr:alpha/beta hydrolase [Lachnospiraceae bacterium]
MKKKAVLYIHGKGGNAEEAKHYGALFPDSCVFGLDYRTDAPWESNKEIERAVSCLAESYDDITLIANSIGAFYSMNADICEKIRRAYFISPMVDLVKLIMDMMKWAKVTEEDLQREKIIKTDFGEDLSWEYLCYVREHPVNWTVPTAILYGSGDHLVSIDTMKGFAERIQADLTVMTGGEHWFHTEEQMAFLDKWIKEKKNAFFNPLNS